ncbi:response regulator transcription factor [Chelatococcus reniformis]|uniref:DNA-binding response regulator n=1 Tax=Chelatococcus reniformis TaxID=1494448 RepID=A0A916TXI9_9HYPH|nr:DNA-binding response regulator [Chelatococcus reniformis]GGC47517.1 DNA-binding response regulator [Chelatococcus reniformis]
MSDAAARPVVLVVDDSAETLSMLTSALEGTGAMVLVAREGAEALKIAERITPDIILLDAVMPGLDGFQTCRELKRIAALAPVPVIFMTGLSETEHILRGLEAGGVDYVTKPLVIDELLARMRVHLANARLSKSARAALDTAGRYLLAVDSGGRLLWSTPQASRLMGPSGRGAGEPVLPAEAQAWVGAQAASDFLATPSIKLGGDAGRTLRLSFVGRLSREEILLRVSEDDAAADIAALRGRYPLTAREAEVLAWVARGKPNRDIAEILGLSPRTVNKHLEQIFSKIGVENRAAAAALATRTLG